MSNAREQILRDIRRSLRRTGPLEQSVEHTLDTRTRNHEIHVQPLVGGDPVVRFVAKMQMVAGSVTRVPSLADVPKALTDYLKLHALSLQVVMAGDAMFESLVWPDELGIEKRAAKRDDAVSVTGAFAAVAETGSVVLVSNENYPTTLNFLPDDHIVVLRAEQIESHIENVWSRLRDLPSMPRTVNFITGPSKTADVEQTIQVGAHGPRRFHVILVDN